MSTVTPGPWRQSFRAGDRHVLEVFVLDDEGVTQALRIFPGLQAARVVGGAVVPA